MFNFLKRLFCVHNFKIIYSFFSVEISGKGSYYQAHVYRSVCTKCGKIHDTYGGRFS